MATGERLFEGALSLVLSFLFKSLRLVASSISLDFDSSLTKTPGSSICLNNGDASMPYEVEGAFERPDSLCYNKSMLVFFIALSFIELIESFSSTSSIKDVLRESLVPCFSNFFSTSNA